MKQLLLVLFLTLTPAAYLTAATVKGWVKDAQTGEELIGAAVYVKENPAMGTTAVSYTHLTLPTILRV